MGGRFQLIVVCLKINVRICNVFSNICNRGCLQNLPAPCISSCKPNFSLPAHFAASRSCFHHLPSDFSCLLEGHALLSWGLSSLGQGLVICKAFLFIFLYRREAMLGICAVAGSDIGSCVYSKLFSFYSPSRAVSVGLPKPLCSRLLLSHRHSSF